MMVMVEQQLQAAVTAVTGARPVQLRPVAGGCIHTSSQVILEDGRCLFLKCNRAQLLPVLTCEAEGLSALQGLGSPLVIPTPRWCGVVNEQAVLLMDWLELRGNSALGWEDLGRGLARLHRLGCGDRYGWRNNNFIGRSPQVNTPMDHWGLFFVEQRLKPQFAMAATRGIVYASAEELLAAVPRWLCGHHASPCLVHGDLWSGNAGINRKGQGCLFDPAIHYADREVDVAMARLFGGFPDRFFMAYEQEWPLPLGHRQRCRLYNLYHLLNHANLFSGSYERQCEQCITELLASPPQW